jgi:hypothetical protein
MARNCSRFFSSDSGCARSASVTARLIAVASKRTAVVVAAAAGDAEGAVPTVVVVIAVEAATFGAANDEGGGRKEEDKRDIMGTGSECAAALMGCVIGVEGGAGGKGLGAKGVIMDGT